jgi:hypothetical protein
MAGERLDTDITVGDSFRAVQFTPYHSQCSIAFGRGLTTADPEGRSYQTYASFTDPDGNAWLLQEIKSRLPGREWLD